MSEANELETPAQKIGVDFPTIFAKGNDPCNATCERCGHPVSRHGINAYNNEGRIHCWDCIGCGVKEVFD